MVAITKTNETNYDVNLVQNRTYIYVNRKANARIMDVDWKYKDLIYWKSYTIKETDMRQETASFVTPQHFDLSTGQYCVLITSPYHKDFAGIILSVEYDEEEGLYTYQCQDFSRTYQPKTDFIGVNITLHRLLKFLITKGNIPIKGKISKQQKKDWKRVLSGLKPASHYEQKLAGAKKNFNPMTEKLNLVVHDKSWIEVIRNLVYGSGAYIDVYFDKYGIVHINPYHKNDIKKGLVLSARNVMERNFKFDTTNMVTGVIVQAKDKMDVGVYYDSRDVVNLDLGVFFGDMVTSVSNPNTAKTSGSVGTSKKSTTTKNTNNPYGTKKKKVYISSDNIAGKTADKKFMNDVAKKLRKNGWTTKVIGLGPNSHYYPNYSKSCKDGVWFCIFGGADAAVFKQCVTNNAYTNAEKKNGVRTVIGMHGGGDIRKGGKYYKYLPRAHDDNYSASSFKGVSYPLKMLTDGKVPIMYASSVDDMVAKFLAGGDNPKAC